MLVTVAAPEAPGDGATASIELVGRTCTLTRPRVQKLPGKPDPETAAPAALARGNFVEVSYGDYVQF